MQQYKLIKYTRNILILLGFFMSEICVSQQQKLRILNFSGDSGYQHSSKKQGQTMITDIAESNGWELVNSSDPTIFNLRELFRFDVVIFNNNCGTDGNIFTKEQQQTFQQYVRNGGGFVGIHCAGTIWHEGGQFQQWYEKLIGTRLVTHPHVQKAKLIVENTNHSITRHVPKEWVITDEWHQFAYNPRESVNVLLSLDENSYEGKEKMGGDHPFTWYQHFDGGRSFFTSLGHTKAIYGDKNFQKLVANGLQWAMGNNQETEITLPETEGLLLDLDADYGVKLEAGNKITSWNNSIEKDNVGSFYKRDKGRTIKGSGRPRLVMNKASINGHNTVAFHRQELLNDNEEVFDTSLQVAVIHGFL